MADSNPNRAQSGNGTAKAGIPAGAPAPSNASVPGSASREHPYDAIPLPAHGFETLDLPVRELATIPAREVISRAAVGLINASAEKLGLVPTEEPDLDLPDARRLIEALAGLLAASRDSLEGHREPLVDGLRTLQRAFREASVHPDPPGQGPGESLQQ